MHSHFTTTLAASDSPPWLLPGTPPAGTVSLPQRLLHEIPPPAGHA